MKARKQAIEKRELLSAARSRAEAFRIDQILTIKSMEEVGAAKCYWVKSKFDREEKHNTLRLRALLNDR
jgi:hypothetical protein